MKTTLLILLLLFSLAPARAADVLERRIDVVFKQTPLKDALQVIAQQAGFEWSYNAKILDANRKASLIANDWTVRETLYELLGEGYEFKTNGNYLILKKRKKPAEELSGYIKDPVTGQRLANATVYDRQTLRATTTDSNGYYELKVKKSTEIVVARLDYRDTIFPVTRQTPRFQKIDLQVNTTVVPRQRTLEENIEIVATRAERFFQASLEKWNALNVQDSLHRRYQISFLPIVGTNHTLSAKVVNDWSFNILAGTSLGNRRLEVAGIGNFTKEEIKGVQVGGIFNELRGDLRGVQVAGIYNHSGDTLSGLQVGGIVNRARHSEGAASQISGIANYSRSGTVLLQIGGIYNELDGNIQGLQVGGLFNRISDTLSGVQVAGMVNRTRHVFGAALQVAGLSNHIQSGTLSLQVAGIANTADSVDGIQVACIVNRARKVRGLQLGLFNSAKELQGLQIGLINRSGRRVLPFINW